MKNPKITNLLDEILNYISENQSEKEEQSEEEKPIVIQASLPVPTLTDVQSRTKGDITGYSDDEQVDELLFRTKGIIGYGDGGGEADESSENNYVDKWKVPTIKVKLLPTTPLRLIKRFRKIYKIFSHENMLIERNELVSILDYMYQQNMSGSPIYWFWFKESSVDTENQSNGNR